MRQEPNNVYAYEYSPMLPSISYKRNAHEAWARPRRSTAVSTLTLLLRGVDKWSQHSVNAGRLVGNISSPAWKLRS